ncbi:vacuolar protein sorting protein Vps66 [Ilyonectria robusta]
MPRRRSHQAARSYRTLTPLVNQAGSSRISPDSTVASSSLSEPSPSYASLVFCAALFLFRLPLFIIAFSAYFLVLQWVHPGPVGNKLCLWTLMAILGVWWTDLQIDRVKPGSLAQQPLWRLPHPGCIMVVSATHLIDAIFLAAVFDPIFTVLHPRSRLVRELSLLQAIFRIGTNETSPPSHANLTDLKTVLERHPDRIIAVLADYSATNGTGTVPSTLNLSDTVRIFRVSIQYLPVDVSTQVSASQEYPAGPHTSSPQSSWWQNCHGAPSVSTSSEPSPCFWKYTECRSYVCGPFGLSLCQEVAGC